MGHCRPLYVLTNKVLELRMKQERENFNTNICLKYVKTVLHSCEKRAIPGLFLFIFIEMIQLKFVLHNH